MIGLVGIIGAELNAETRGTCKRMLEVLLHGTAGAWSSLEQPQLKAIIGWCDRDARVSVEPYWSADGTLCLLLSGDYFANGHCTGMEGTESLFNRYRLDPETFFCSLNGRFAGVILDLAEKSAVLFNDRFGLRRLYYHEAGNVVHFATEAKGLLAVLPQTRQFDVQGLGEYYSCGCALQGRTLFRGLSIIPGGARWKFSPEKEVQKGRYFDSARWENLPKLAPGPFYESLRGLFSKIAPRYREGAERVGVSLTGGVDSRMLMAWLNAPAESVPTYTFGGPNRESHDVKIARKIARICRQSHQVIGLGDDFLKQFASLARDTVYLSDGAMDMTGAPDLFANRIAKTIAPVRLTGNYGGEILRGIVAFKPMRLKRELLAPEIQLSVATAEQIYSAERQVPDLSFIAFKQVPWHHYSRLSLEQAVLDVRSPYLDNSLVELMYRAPAEVMRSNEVSLRLISDGSVALGRLGTDRGIYGGGRGLRTYYSNGIEEFLFRAEYAFDYGMPDWLAKVDRALRPLRTERLFLGRHKFYHFRSWYRNELAEYVKEVLLDSQALSRAYINRSVLEKFVCDHTSGSSNRTLEIHRALSLELIERHLFRF
jgi:asparagine synthase (glutamine-hydrolysing)